jgi:signal transduction histidine kinase
MLMSNPNIEPVVLESLRMVVLQRPDLRETGPFSPMLGLLYAADPRELAQIATERYYAPGEIIFEEGQSGDTLYVIWSGRVAVVKGDLNSPVILAVLEPGKIFGEMAILENRPRSATVLALDELRLLEVNRQGFERMLRQFPEIGRGIMAFLSANLRRMSETSSSGERNQELLSRQVSNLEQEKLRLEELQRLRQETTDLIIHDLRNPLGAIEMSWKVLSLLLPEDARRANADILEVAQANMTRMRRLVDTLLDVSRLETGETALSLVPVDLAELAGSLAHSQSVLAQQGVTFRLDFPPNLPAVPADRDKIERVLANLLDNAIKYSPRHSVIALSCQCSGEWVDVWITDQGPGIPAEERQRIFERFAQVEGQKRGFGLGLSYCKLAVERHGGKIWVEEGEDGRGSRFVFRLPVGPG